jgi:hypothetical protein
VRNVTDQSEQTEKSTISREEKAIEVVVSETIVSIRPVEMRLSESNKRLLQAHQDNQDRA